MKDQCRFELNKDVSTHRNYYKKGEVKTKKEWEYIFKVFITEWYEERKNK